MIRNWTLIATSLMLLAACGKKDESAVSQPTISAPDNVEKVAAATVVKASSGPVELTLQLHATEIKVGEYLWEQVGERNIGSQEIVVLDSIFQDARELRKQSRGRYGLYLEAIAPNGKAVPVNYAMAFNQANDFATDVSGLLEVRNAQEQAMVDSWKKQGLRPEVINKKLLDYNLKRESHVESSPAMTLAPGQSMKSQSAVFYSVKDHMDGKTVPKPIGDFAQLDFFEFDKPGEYKIRAVFDHAPTPETMKMRGKMPFYPEEVSIYTPWIKIKVSP